MENVSFYNLSLSDLKDLCQQEGAPSFAAKQLFDWVYRKDVFDPNEWSNVSKKARERFLELFNMDIPKVVWDVGSKDGTHKFLMGLSDLQTVEAVLIPAKDRLTLCISSQVGCAIGCTFCHTGTQGLKRHLETHEIVGQYLAASKWLKENVDPEKKITNIVFMGQGEPLHNFDNAKKAIEIFLDPLGIGLGQRRITLSTSGLVPQIKKLADFPPVNIAISLHSAKDDVRSELMPINKVYDLKRLFEAIKSIPLKAHRRITYEYLMIAGLNDTPEDIEALCELIPRTESKINLIPFNEYPGSNFKRPTDESIQAFSRKLIERGYVSTVRVTKGHDILAACGQLKTSLEKKNLWA